MKHSKLGLYIITAMLMTAGCKKSDPTPVDPVVTTPTDPSSTPITSPARETFENGSKDNYTDSTISLSTGKWNFSNAVIGNSADDRKNGAKSARIQETGKITMNFDIVGGVYRVAIASGTFGTDGPATWQLWASTNSGYSYSQVGSNLSTSGATLQNDTIVVNVLGKIRFSIRKLSAAGRLNIDDFSAILTSGPLAPNYTDNNNMLLGNPDNASPSPLDVNDYYMDKIYYSISYNKGLGIANWSSWHLSTAELGTAPRQDDFRPDDALPADWYHAANESYTGSGFDRGHQCPSNDRTSSIPANSSTFLMTNIVPQAPNVNQGPWQKFEDSCNRFVTSLGKEVYIICGSYGVGGVGNNGALTDVDNGNITVPARLWKVAVVISNGNNDLSRIDNNTRVIAVDMPNDNSIGISTSWKGYRVSVDEIEAAVTLATGRPFNLLSNLPEAVQQVVENRTDNF